MMFYEMKEKLEQILYLPEILIKEGEQLPRENEDIELEQPAAIHV